MACPPHLTSPRLGTTCGKHYFSDGEAGLRSWSTHGCAYQAKGVAFADGTTRDFGRRERPHVVFGPTPGRAGAPRVVALSTAVTPMPTKCIGKPCLWRWPDASYTLLQAVAAKDEAAVVDGVASA